jgi:hypothetical protein
LNGRLAEIYEILRGWPSNTLEKQQFF